MTSIPYVAPQRMALGLTILRIVVGIVFIAHGVQGLDTPRFERARTAPVTPLVNQAFAQAKRFRITAAPAFVLQKGATQELVHWQTLTNLEFDAPIEAILRNG